MSNQTSTHRLWIKRGAWILLAIAVGVIVTQIPVEEIVEPIDDALGDLGFAGMAIFVAGYIVVTLLLLPGSILTIAAGLAFGLLWGTLAVMVGAIISMMLAYLIARYIARDRVAHFVKSRPRFRAIDRAIDKGGWRIVALMRLAPGMPFGPLNYMYGLSPLGFWPAILASTVVMLPKIFLLIYVGHLGRTGLDMNAENGVQAGEWALRIAGLIAAVALIAYITWLARRELKKMGALEDSD